MVVKLTAIDKQGDMTLRNMNVKVVSVLKLTVRVKNLKFATHLKFPTK